MLLLAVLSSPVAEAGPWSQVDLYNADVLVEGYPLDRLGTDIVVGDLNGDGDLDLVVSSPAPVDEQVLVFFGPILGSNLTRADADVVIVGDPGSGFGQSVAIGELSGSGDLDLVIGAPHQDKLGAVFLFEGPFTAGITPWSVAHRIDGIELAPGDRPLTGYAVATANVDGIAGDELLVGAPGARGGNGDAYLIPDPSSFTEVAPGTGQFINTGMFGWAVANAGDLNGDGMDEIAIGAPLEDTSGADAGLVVLVYGHPNLTDRGFGRTTLPPPPTASGFPIAYTRIWGEAAGDNLGWSVAGAGDLNQDGYDDLLVGSPGLRGGSGGAVHSILGGADRGPDPLLDRVIIGSNTVDQLRGTTWTGTLGVGVDVAGAIDTSPTIWGGEVLIGSASDGAWLRPWTLQIVTPLYNCQLDLETNEWSCHGPLASHNAPPTQQVILLGSGLEGRFTGSWGLGAGSVVAGGGDLDGDGVDDLAFGEPILSSPPDTSGDPAVCTEQVLCSGKAMVVHGQP